MTWNTGNTIEAKPKNLQYRSDWDTENDGNIDKEEREKAAESSE